MKSKKPASKCKRCDKPIQWSQSYDESAQVVRWIPLDPTSKEDHRSTCTPADPTKQSSFTCRNCQQPIKWKQAESGRWIPMNIRSQTNHLETCEKLDANVRNRIRDRAHDQRVRDFFEAERRKRIGGPINFDQFN